MKRVCAIKLLKICRAFGDFRWREWWELWRYWVDKLSIEGLSLAIIYVDFFRGKLQGRIVLYWLGDCRKKLWGYLFWGRKGWFDCVLLTKLWPRRENCFSSSISSIDWPSPNYPTGFFSCSNRWDKKNSKSYRLKILLRHEIIAVGQIFKMLIRYQLSNVIIFLLLILIDVGFEIVKVNYEGYSTLLA